MERIAANDLYQEKQRWESDYGTVVLGYVAASPMSTGYTLQLVTKPAAAVGEGLGHRPASGRQGRSAREPGS